ncbi:MAG: type I DNA topoisomerase [Alphaproteobacteria bacterium]|nr:type I DNA topoisomerase [Alphaproteobacteria bacterium]
MKLVIVESPAKAKTINRYLGDDYKVLASYGHVCDLPSKDGSVLPDEDFAMKWQVSGGSEKRIGEISSALKSADRLILATDPDREGEAISWHVLELLQDRGLVKDKPVERVVFNEVTKNAILAAMAQPRELDTELIDAYRARRALDYLVGFSISPVLWRKLPGARSAGRVQSVALRLICEREAAIEAFNAQEYWTVEAELGKADGRNFNARLTHLNGKKLGKLDITSETEAFAAAAAIEAEGLSVVDIQTKRIRENPKPPFTTSTLQQEASRKLGFSASRTMQIAQKLYEGVNIGSETTGLITYMRTDGVQLGSEALASVRGEIGQRFGNRYLPNSPRIYRTAAANAQEAHEAIRPTDISRAPQEISDYLDYDQKRLYDLIWKRTITSQMESAELDQTAIDMSNASQSVMLRASGRVVVFDGYRSVYQEGRDSTSDAVETDKQDESAILPAVDKGERLATRKVKPEQHFTQPPPRFTDASLVKAMEELGIGRPSTYASIIQVLQDRTYVVKDRGKFIPEDRGRLVVSFLNNFFARYVEYDFTAKLEGQLDEVSDGKLDWKMLLERFWRDFKVAIDSTTELTITNVIDVLDEELGGHFFKKDDQGELMRSCPNCQGGRLGLRLGKFGAFIGCSNYPECKFTRQLVTSSDDPASEEGVVGDRHLGDDQASGLPVYIRNGPYGPYVQLGDPETKKPKRSSLPKGTSAGGVDLDAALKLLSLPRDVGAHPESGDMIQAGLGRYGPYLKYQGSFTSLKDGDDLLEIGLNRAVDLLAESAKKRGRLLGEHPSGGEVHLKAGRFGPYVEHNKLRATLPRGTDMTEVELAQAIELLAAKAAKGGGTAKKGAAKKGAAKKDTAKKKAAAKKGAAKKATKKKAAS